MERRIGGERGTSPLPNPPSLPPKGSILLRLAGFAVSIRRKGLLKRASCSKKEAVCGFGGVPRASEFPITAPRSREQSSIIRPHA